VFIIRDSERKKLIYDVLINKDEFEAIKKDQEIRRRKRYKLLKIDVDKATKGLLEILA